MFCSAATRDLSVVCACQASSCIGIGSHRLLGSHDLFIRGCATVHLTVTQLTLCLVSTQAYDRAAICARGVKDAKLNFRLSEYTAELESLRATPLDQLAATLR